MRDGFVQRGGPWVLGQCALLVCVAALNIAGRTEAKDPKLQFTGLFFLGVSALCGIAGAVALGRNLTPFPKPAAKTKLCQRGIYGLIRHPLYISVVLGVIGWSFFQNCWPALGVSMVLAVFLDAKARREERWLRQQFQEYAAYERRVRRFIPGIY